MGGVGSRPEGGIKENRLRLEDIPKTRGVGDGNGEGGGHQA